MSVAPWPGDLQDMRKRLEAAEYAHQGAAAGGERVASAGRKRNAAQMKAGRDIAACVVWSEGPAQALCRTACCWAPEPVCVALVTTMHAGHTADCMPVGAMTTHCHAQV